MGTLLLDGYRLHYTLHISDRHRPTLLFIHSMTMDASEWDLLTDALGSDLNFMTYDMYGHGQTGIGGELLSPELLVSEALAVIDAAGLGNVHIVGSGLGGTIGFEIARRQPERVASLSLLSAIFYFPEFDYGRLLTLVTQLIDIDRDLLMDKLMMDSFYHPTEEKSVRFRAAFQHIPADVIKDSVAYLRHLYAPERFHFSDALSRLRVPTLVMHGERDPIFPAQMGAVYSACIPNSRWFTIPEASRIFSIDRPDLTALNLKKFILSDKVPIPVTPNHEELIAGFRKIVQNGLSKRPEHRHRLCMNIMHDIEVLWNGRPIEGKWNQRRAKELLLFLIFRKGLVKRKELMDTFLPGLPIVQARNNLRVWISHLNKIFHDCPHPSVHEVLIIGEDTIAVNAELQSDFISYIGQLDSLVKNKKPLNERAITFIRLLSSYHPANFSSFRGDWIFSITDEIEEKLADVMEQLLPALEKRKMVGAMREILHSGKSIEPYDGFCDEKLAELQSAPL